MNQKIYTYQVLDSAGKSMPKLLVQIYEGTIRKLREASASYEKEDYETGLAALEKAKTVMVHLYTSLDKEKGGEIADKLGQLYAFVVERINYIQATKDTKTIEDCIGILDNIRSAWEELAAREKSGDKTKTEQKQAEPKKPAKRLSVSI